MTLDDQEPKRARARKSNGTEEEDFYSLVTMGLVLVLSFARVPKEVKPNDEEIDIFSRHLSAIIVRHFPALGNLSPDAKDVIGILIVVNSYYARVSDDLKRLRAPRIVEGRTVTPPPESQATAEVETRPANDIATRAPRLDQFLSEAERHAGGAA